MLKQILVSGPAAGSIAEHGQDGFLSSLTDRAGEK
jgi:hypothetical protein